MSFPTDLARMLASQVGLHPTSAKSETKPPARKPKAAKVKKREAVKPERSGEELIERLKQFQLLGVANNFEDSVVAYYGFECSPQQTDALKAIHIHTQGWAKSVVISRMIEATSSPTTKNRANLDTDRRSLGNISNQALDRLIGPVGKTLKINSVTKNDTPVAPPTSTPTRTTLAEETLEGEALVRELQERGLGGLGLEE